MKTIKGNEQGSILHSNNPTIVLKLAITRFMLVAKSLGVHFANDKKNFTLIIHESSMYLQIHLWKTVVGHLLN